MALSIYGRRRQRREDGGVTEFGFDTWWLTMETAILKHTADLVRENRGVRYIMRPDFLLNFLTLAPRAAEARETFSKVLPSLIGFRLSRRMDETMFHRLMRKVEEADDVDESRRAAMIATLSDELKSDFDKQYLSSLRAP
jgi:hypothetical protein